MFNCSHLRYKLANNWQSCVHCLTGTTTVHNLAKISTLHHSLQPNITCRTKTIEYPIEDVSFGKEANLVCPTSTDRGSSKIHNSCSSLNILCPVSLFCNLDAWEVLCCKRQDTRFSQSFRKWKPIGNGVDKYFEIFQRLNCSVQGLKCFQEESLKEIYAACPAECVRLDFHSLQPSTVLESPSFTWKDRPCLGGWAGKHPDCMALCTAPYKKSFRRCHSRLWNKISTDKEGGEGLQLLQLSDWTESLALGKGFGSPTTSFMAKLEKKSQRRGTSMRLVLYWDLPRKSANAGHDFRKEWNWILRAWIEDVPETSLCTSLVPTKPVAPVIATICWGCKLAITPKWAPTELLKSQTLSGVISNGKTRKEDNQRRRIEDFNQIASTLIHCYKLDNKDVIQTRRDD